MERKIRRIPAQTERIEKLVVAYVRVSSNTVDQLESLKAQISGLVRMVSKHNNWKLVDVYADIDSAKKGTHRPEFNKMLNECKAGLTDIVVVKSVSRFGRDIVELLDAINSLREEDVRVIFVDDNLDTLVSDNSVIISALGVIAQEENESRRQDILWGMKQKAEDGNLGFYRRKCYGYDKNENGDLVINEKEAEVVKLIFDLYLDGKSVFRIIKELQSRGIKSPTGKDNWPKRSIEKMLSNEKYIGNAVVNVGGEEGHIYKLNNSHQAIISKDTFDVVQDKKLKRSNIVTDESGTHRSNKKYSSKKA